MPSTPPPVLARNLGDDPVGHRSHARHADLAAFEIVRGLDRAVVAHHQREDQRLVRHRGDAPDRRALGDESQAGPAAEPDVDAIGRHRLLQLGVAAEGADGEVEAMLLKDAGLLTDVDRNKREGFRTGLADAQGFGVCRMTAQRHRRSKKRRANGALHAIGYWHFLPPVIDSPSEARKPCQAGLAFALIALRSRSVAVASTEPSAASTTP
jgi:hypothetical protein